MLLDLEKVYFKMPFFSQFGLQFNAIPIKTPSNYFVDINKLVLKFIRRGKRPRVANAVFKKVKAGGLMYQTSHDSVALMKEETHLLIKHHGAQKNNCSNPVNCSLTQEQKLPKVKRQSLQDVVMEQQKFLGKILHFLQKK